MRRAWPLFVLLVGCQQAPAPPAPPSPSAIPTATPTPMPSPASPVTIDMSVLPSSVVVGKPTQLTPKLALTDRVAWSLDDASKATLSAEGVLTGLVPGVVTAIATANGHTATARLALLDPACKAREVPGPWQLVQDHPSYVVITQAGDWAGLFKENPVPPVDFSSEAVLVASAYADGEANPRLHQPEPVLAATSPRFLVVSPERQSVFAELMASASAPGFRTFAWAIPRGDVGNEVAGAGVPGRYP